MSAHHEHNKSHTQGRMPTLEAILKISMAAEFLRQRVDKACAPLQINGGQYAILRLLKRAYPNGMSRSEIVKHLIEKTNDVTRQIDGLVEKGYAERIRVEEDRRLSLAKITESGIAALMQIDPLFHTMLKEISASVSEDECMQLSNLCEKIYSSSHSE